MILCNFKIFNIFGMNKDVDHVLSILISNIHAIHFFIFFAIVFLFFNSYLPHFASSLEISIYNELH
jgi:hypothetical protein